MKTFFAVIAAVIGVAAFYPYLRDTFSLKTKPHAYTWLIWTITQGTATAAIWYGGGGLGGLNLAICTFLIASVFFFSLRFGTKNITKADTAVLVAALVAIIFWWRLHEPVLAVLMVSLIDILGYIPSFRKSYREPWSETLVSWAAFVVSDIFALLALREYNLLTMTYIISIAVSNAALVFFCLSRRRSLPPPSGAGPQ